MVIGLKGKDSCIASNGANKEVTMAPCDESDLKQRYRSFGGTGTWYFMSLDSPGYCLHAEDINLDGVPTLQLQPCPPGGSIDHTWRFQPNSQNTGLNGTVTMWNVKYQDDLCLGMYHNLQTPVLSKCDYFKTR